MIRQGTIADLPGVFAIADAWVGKTAKPYYQGEEIRSSLREAVQKGTKHLLIAEENGRVAGFAIYEMEGLIAFIKLIMVSPGNLRLGIASALIRAVVDRHNQVGAWNDVGPSMREMYERLGFRCTDKVQPGQYRNWELKRA